MDFLRRVARPILLLLLTPLVAEYLLGDIPTSNLWALPALALMYGSGAVLVREAVRRTGGGLAGFVLFALAYGLLEEGLITQSLFNPTYLHLRLLDYGFVPALGTAPPWLVYVLGLHVVWSLAVPIGLAESLFAGRRRDPWLNRFGLVLFSLMFLAGLAMVASYSLKQAEHYASPAQLGATLVLVLALVAVALSIRPKRAGDADRLRPPPATATLAICFVLGSLHPLSYGTGGLRLHWPWPATIAAGLLVDAALVAWFAYATRGRAWRAIDAWAAATGGMLVYAWFGYTILHGLHNDADLQGHSVLVALMLGLSAVAGLQAAGASRRAQAEGSGDPRFA